MTRRFRTALFLIIAMAACRGREQSAAGSTRDVGGTLIIAAVAEPKTLLPPAFTSGAEKQIFDQIFDYLAEIGPDLNTTGDAGWVPRLARSWSWSSDSLSIAFHIDPRARWHDGHPVTAGDIRFSAALYKNPRVQSIVASAFQNLDSIAVTDSLTAVAWFHQRTPEQFFNLAYNLMVMPEHLLHDIDPADMANSPFARAPVGSGPFRFVRWTPRSAIEVVANTTYYRGRPRLDRVVWTWNPDPAAALTRTLSGDADFYEALTPEALPQVAASPLVRTVPYRAISYGFLVYNLADPQNPRRPHALFADHGLRVALTMAMDRRAMVRNVFDSLGALSYGPFSSAYSSADTTLPQIPYDTLAAARMLDSLGWRDTDGDGVRDRAGRSLEFSLLVPSSSLPRRRYSVLIQEQLRRVGVRVNIQELDFSTTVAQIFAGKFDAMLNGVVGDPSPGALRQSWKSAPPTERGFNFAAYSNARVDALIDSAASEFRPAKARELYRSAYRQIMADAPAVWLYETRPHAAVNRRLRVVSDSADIWWRDMRLWWIPAGERIARDRAGLGPQSNE